MNIHKVISECGMGAEAHLNMISGCQGSVEMTQCTEGRTECVTFRAATTHTHNLKRFHPPLALVPGDAGLINGALQRERERERGRGREVWLGGV